MPGIKAEHFTHSEYTIGSGTVAAWSNGQSPAALPKNTDTDRVITIVPSAVNTAIAASVLERQQGTPQCKTGFTAGASSYEVGQRILDLKARTDDCGLDAGACEMLECAYSAGIQWCNKNDHFASWKCADFATHAKAASDYCTYATNFEGEETWGITPDAQDFEVWVGYFPC